MVDTDFGVLDGGIDLEAAQGFAGAVGVAVHQVTDHVGHIVFRAGQPVLHGDKVGAHVLRGTGDEAQNFRQLAQHLHLLVAGRSFLFAGLRSHVGIGRLAAQALEELHRAAAGAGHVELAHARELGHFSGRHQADHGVALVAARAQRLEHRQKVVFHEQHGGDDDVAPGDVSLAALQRGRVFVPVGGGVHAQRQAGHRAGQPAVGAFGGAGQVTVHRDQHDAHPRSAGRSAGAVSG